MIVVSNTSPLCYLVLIGRAEVLPKLYGTIHTSRTVVAELQHVDAPEMLRAWAKHLPDWVQVHPDPEEKDQIFAILHRGERTAIQLAERIRADIVLLDDSAARLIAAQRDLKISGLLGVLRDAAGAGMIDLPETIDRLRQTNFRASPQSLKSLLPPKR